MIKHYLLLLLGLTLSLGLSAQKIRVGIIGGLNRSTFSTSLDVRGRTGIHVGGFARVKQGKWAIQPEVLFSQQGATIRTGGQSLKHNFNYIVVPVIIKRYILLGFNLQFGPQLGLLSLAEAGGNDISSLYRGSDLAFTFGGGLDFSRLTFNARYTLGLTDIADDATAILAQNQVFMISLGFVLYKS